MSNLGPNYPGYGSGSGKLSSSPNQFITLHTAPNLILEYTFFTFSDFIIRDKNI